MIGLGRMGANMAERLERGGHSVVGYSLDEAEVAAAVETGVTGASSLEELVGKLTAPRAVWCMVPSGSVTEGVIDSLIPLLEAGDTIIEGGNSNYKDSMRRAEKVAEHGLHYLDAGTSGGGWGLQNGYSLMVGGDPEVFARWEPIFQTLAPGPDKGYGLVGPSGAGHFTKMVHNGIEYGMMQSLGEGFELMAKKEVLDLDLHQIARVWQHGSVIVSWLLDLAVLALEEDPRLEKLEAYVEDSGEGRWTVQEAIELESAAEVLTLSLLRRFRSRDASPFSDRMLAALRNQFGGHAVKKADS